METNEQIRRELKKALEEELESFLEQVSQMTEGELEQLEERVVKEQSGYGPKADGRSAQQSAAHVSSGGKAAGELRACATAGGRTCEGTDHTRRPGQPGACVLSMLACWRSGRGGAYL